MADMIGWQTARTLLRNYGQEISRFANQTLDDARGVTVYDAPYLAFRAPDREGYVDVGEFIATGDGARYHIQLHPETGHIRESW